MKIYNNLSAISILNEADRNEKKKGKALKQLGLGERITGAGDDASGYAITERMKIQMRGLSQDQQNVKNGADMLRVAEGAIQSQINLLRTVKEKVIQAANDTNTDADRLIIQKEINHCYEEINDISAETTYNGMHLLIGNAIEEDFASWVVLDHAEMIEGSDSLQLIPDIFSSLDDQVGPFDTFGKADEAVPWDGYKLTNIPAEGLEGSAQLDNKYHDAGDNTPRIMEIDFSKAVDVGGTVDDLDNTSFYIENPNDKGHDALCILTKTPANNYRKYTGDGDSQGKVIVDISGCSTFEDVAQAVKAKLAGDSPTNSTYKLECDGAKLKLTTKNDGEGVNNSSSYNIKQASVTGGSDTVYVGKTPGSPAVPERTGAAGTGLISGTQNLSGGANEVSHTVEVGGHWEYAVPGDDDSKHWVKDTEKVVDSPAKKASTVVNGISGVANGTGITIIGYGSNTYVTFVDGAVGPKRTYSDSLTGASQYYTIGKDFTGSWSANGMSISFADGNMTLTATSAGSSANSYGVKDGFVTVPAIPAVPANSGTPVTTTYTATTPLKIDALNNMVQEGTNGARAHWDIDLSAYNSSDGAKAEALISNYVGKILKGSGYVTSYEFIDNGSGEKLDGLAKGPTMSPYNGTSPGGSVASSTIDLNSVRTLVTGGKTVAEAFSTVVKNALGSNAAFMREDPADSTSAIVGVQFLATVYGKSGNSQTMAASEGELRHYTIDFSGITGMPESLDKKGFRFYCATDSAQWVNVFLYNGPDSIDLDKPASGTDELDIKTLMVDVSGVKDSKGLVALLNEKLGDYLENNYKHNFALASDAENGKLTIYDKRRFTVMNKDYYLDKQSHGAKIADGVMDNVVQDHRYLYVKDLYIQHTTQASKNIHIKIPQTSMDQIFGYKIGTHQIEDFNVLTKEMRDKLLGSDGPPKVEGILDAGLQYLIDANTLIGAQINHMEYAEQNIVTELENVTASESVMRDTDMAKAMTEFTKFNILGQAAQSMLAQANQTPQSTLSLLQ